MSGHFDHVADEGLRRVLERVYRTARAMPQKPLSRPPQPLWQRCGDCGGTTRWDGRLWLCEPCTWRADG